MMMLDVSALFWSAAFPAFATIYGPMLLRPRIDEGRRAA